MRAIDSIHAAGEPSVHLVVVVNGQRYDSDLLRSLRSRTDLEVLYLAEGSLVQAHLAGRAAVASPYFCFLDDDDEFLAGALAVRLRALQGAPGSDIVVTNGYSRRGGEDALMYARIGSVDSNPLAELFQENWLHNCNHLFRTDAVPIRYFESSQPFMEWTWLAFQLALDSRKIVSLDVPTFRYHDTSGSLSKSDAFIFSRVQAYRRMLDADPPAAIVDMIKRRSCNAWHDIAMYELRQARRARAIAAHIRSVLSHRTGMRYLPFTRRLIRRPT
jgi:glycosyltransferase involved in cell wall biosynthesis